MNLGDLSVYTACQQEREKVRVRKGQGQKGGILCFAVPPIHLFFCECVVGIGGEVCRYTFTSS